jgi:hypothetical protein
MRRLAAALLLLALPALTGCGLPDNQPRVSIEFGAVPELEGATVLIDGKAVGKLEKTGQATRINFPVPKGTHEVTLQSPQFDCRPVQINAELTAQKIRLMVDVAETASIGGKPSLILRY